MSGSPVPTRFIDANNLFVVSYQDKEIDLSFNSGDNSGKLVLLTNCSKIKL